MAKSIAAQQTQPTDKKGELAESSAKVDLPALFGESAGIEIIPRFNVPYLIFAQPAAKDQWKDLLLKFPDIEDGDPVLFFPAPEKPVRPAPLRMTICAAKQYYVVRDAQGKILSSHQKPAADRDEYIQAALIVYLPDRAVPCTCLAKTVKCGAFHTLSSEIELASQESWMKQSDAHAAAVAACSVPFARVVATVSIGSKSGRSTGIAYKPTRATVAPTSSVEWALLAPLLTEEGRKRLQEVADAYKAQLAKIDWAKE